jgi:hypothetical protein
MPIAVSAGYDFSLFSRPELYNMLFSKTPSHKLHLGKKLLSFEQDQDGVKVQFDDGSIVEGDILVGADGAHSSVRQHLYKTLDKQGLLPKCDTESMNKGYISLLGTTDPLDPTKYPILTARHSEISFIIGDKNTPYTVSYIRQHNTKQHIAKDPFNLTPATSIFRCCLV